MPKISSDVLYLAPSPIELFRWAKIGNELSEPAKLILDEGVVCEESIAILCGEYANLKRRKHYEG